MGCFINQDKLEPKATFRAILYTIRHVNGPSIKANCILVDYYKPNFIYYVLKSIRTYCSIDFSCLIGKKSCAAYLPSNSILFHMCKSSNAVQGVLDIASFCIGAIYF